METKAYLSWVDFYMELADKLLAYKNNRKTLIDKVKAIYTAINMRLPKLEKDNKIVDIDPFTIFGLFNKGITNANRISILRGFAQEFSVKAQVPDSFDGIPVLNNMAATFYCFIGDRQENDIENLWQVFVSALEYANTHSDSSKKTFVAAYDVASQQKGVKWNLTMALYWIRPYEYINLDSRNRWYICNPENMPVDYIESIGAFETVPTGAEYLAIVDKSRAVLEKGNYRYKNFPELSYYAWVISEQVNEENRAAAVENTRVNAGEAIGDKDVHTVHYWIYSPGYGSAMWDKFYEDGVMAIAREHIGDLRQFASRKEMQDRMMECGGDTGTRSYKNASLETWQFVHELKPGDVIFAKSGKRTIIGRGIVTSDYYYDDSYSDEYRNLRKVNWTHKGEWEHPGNAITKVLTDVTSYTDYVEEISALFEDEVSGDVEEVKIEYPIYTAEDFLSEVYMSRSNYDILSNLLINKKNIIMQGAPGVGKTFAAKRLAYSMMGVKDPSRVMMVQFHQSYSYEDFIMGFRPASTSFELKKGPFYSFCKKAELDLENDYYFIIDEINRGNLSKIFGELFMLIENDKRGVSLQLLYSDEKFSVPENVYIIGMMNTADRSLAMLDYALRRRFAFFEFSPALETDGFRQYRQGKDNKKFDSLIATIEKLNIAIENDETLGRGFRIGHSYFCTDKPIDDMWLNAVVTYEIVPLLNEYWFDEPSKVRDWEYALREAIR
ncbi:AAA family ATPase [Yanshouia hominis]|uniref:AAA family ATPase n=1 Tax=Yanshouia hominis TaxID=2763673 RepID=A0ABR7NG03_9FIRM|nr:AAA family ATPase [Yanshouia hominis]MBC8575310.1 AAA family ATPase [Yanshouia hominis]